MKKLLISAVAVLGLSSAALAGGLPEDAAPMPTASSSDTGFYVGAEGGYGITNWKNLDISHVVNRDNGFVGRAFLGYDLNRYWAVEGGYTYFFNKAEVTTGAVTSKAKTQNIDVVLKGKLPIVDNFDAYAKVGGNYLMTNRDAGQDNIKHFNLTYGAGFDYAITSNVIANIEWLRFNGKAKVGDAKYQPNTDAFMVGLRYKFDV